MLRPNSRASRPPSRASSAGLGIRSLIPSSVPRSQTKTKIHGIVAFRNPTADEVDGGVVPAWMIHQNALYPFNPDQSIAETETHTATRIIQGSAADLAEAINEHVRPRLLEACCLDILDTAAARAAEARSAAIIAQQTPLPVSFSLTTPATLDPTAAAAVANADSALKELITLYDDKNKTHLIHITGPSMSGKSTLVDAFIPLLAQTLFAATSVHRLKNQLHVVVSVLEDRQKQNYTGTGSKWADLGHRAPSANNASGLTCQTSCTRCQKFFTTRREAKGFYEVPLCHMRDVTHYLVDSAETATRFVQEARAYGSFADNGTHEQSSRGYVSVNFALYHGRLDQPDQRTGVIDMYREKNLHPVGRWIIADSCGDEQIYGEGSAGSALPMNKSFVNGRNIAIRRFFDSVDAKSKQAQSFEDFAKEVLGYGSDNEQTKIIANALAGGQYIPIICVANKAEDKRRSEIVLSGGIRIDPDSIVRWRAMGDHGPASEPRTFSRSTTPQPSTLGLPALSSARRRSSIGPEHQVKQVSGRQNSVALPGLKRSVSLSRSIEPVSAISGASRPAITTSRPTGRALGPPQNRESVGGTGSAQPLLQAVFNSASSTAEPHSNSRPTSVTAVPSALAPAAPELVPSGPVLADSPAPSPTIGDPSQALYTIVGRNNLRQDHLERELEKLLARVETLEAIRRDESLQQAVQSPTDRSIQRTQPVSSQFPPNIHLNIAQKDTLISDRNRNPFRSGQTHVSPSSSQSPSSVYEHSHQLRNQSAMQHSTDAGEHPNRSRLDTGDSSGFSGFSSRFEPSETSPYGRPPGPYESGREVSPLADGTPPPTIASRTGYDQERGRESGMFNPAPPTVPTLRDMSRSQPLQYEEYYSGDGHAARDGHLRYIREPIAQDQEVNAPALGNRVLSGEDRASPQLLDASSLERAPPVIHRQRSATEHRAADAGMRAVHREPLGQQIPSRNVWSYLEHEP